MTTISIVDLPNELLDMTFGMLMDAGQLSSMDALALTCWRFNDVVGGLEGRDPDMHRRADGYFHLMSQRQKVWNAAWEELYDESELY